MVTGMKNPDAIVPVEKVSGGTTAV
jgi:hypothetical protein